MTRKKSFRYSEIPEVEAYKIWWEETEGWKRTEGDIKADAAIEVLRSELDSLEIRIDDLYREISALEVELSVAETRA